MINTTLFLSGKIQFGGEELIEVWKNDVNAKIWVNLCDENQVKEDILLKTLFGIHTLAIQDAQRLRHPPKIENFDDVTFILLRGLSSESIDIEFNTIQLALFVGDRFLVTRHSDKSYSVNNLQAHLKKDNAVFVESTAKLALQLCRLLANRYVDILLKLEPRLEEIEDLMLEQPNDLILAELISYKSRLKKLNRVATYHEKLFRELKNKAFPHFGVDEREHEIIDVWDKQERSQSLSQLYYHNASDLIDGYISVASHRLNQIMKVLTIVMSIFVPLSFLAGIYGMNFENMPELHSKSGYFILLGVMALIATFLIVVFRKVRWL